MILYEIKSNKGTYAGLKLSKDSIKLVDNLIKKFEIQNPIDSSEYHVTLLFSRKYLPKYEPAGKLETHHEAKLLNAELWDTSGDNPKKALVIKLDSESIVQRHKELMKLHKATWDYPNYIPHITLSYNINNDFDINSLNKYLQNQDLEIQLIDEYSNELDLDWKPKNSDDDV